MGIGCTMIILGYTWLMENNPEIDRCTGDVNMTRCLTSCTPNNGLLKYFQAFLIPISTSIPIHCLILYVDIHSQSTGVVQ